MTPVVSATCDADGSITHSVRVEPLGIELRVTHGETIMAAAERLGWRWPTICHGDSQCSACWVRVTEGSDTLSAIAAAERATLGLLPSVVFDGDDPSMIRLACCAQVLGDAVLVKKGVVPEGSG